MAAFWASVSLCSTTPASASCFFNRSIASSSALFGASSDIVFTLHHLTPGHGERPFQGHIGQEGGAGNREPTALPAQPVFEAEGASELYSAHATPCRCPGTHVGRRGVRLHVEHAAAAAPGAGGPGAARHRDLPR